MAAKKKRPARKAAPKSEYFIFDEDTITAHGLWAPNEAEAIELAKSEARVQSDTYVVVRVIGVARQVEPPIEFERKG